MKPSSDSASPTTDRQRWAGVEFRADVRPRPQIRHVLFDFDGTLSLIRQGWPDVMTPMLIEALPRRPGETEAELRKLVTDDIARLTGKQTIYQMIQLAERITQRGGQPREPLWYKHEYLRRLEERIGGRIAGLRSGRIHPDELLVHRARPLLEHLRQRGLQLYLASGTDEPALRQEAELLDIARYFGPHVYGAQDDYLQFSKKIVIDRILREHGVSGQTLLAFGDGYVEIENTKQVGGLAVAVASDEADNGSGRVDPWKRQRLLEVAADVVIPDFREAVPLVEFLLNGDTNSS
ncbi:MAG TPA: HAD family hydrolase [Pirellulales bacterium]|jgi:phosphoglycolate phosphatase-like HAD superfamily hydrolase|nr:HAD family hydrolase [Pirellulales bacterium]